MNTRIVWSFATQMLPEYTKIANFSLLTYTLVVSVGLLISLGIVAWRARKAHPGLKFGRLIDVLLCGAVCGVIAARLFHVVLHWQHFSIHTGEILRLNAGGLDWHGAVLGTLIGLGIAARWWVVPFGVLREGLLLALPLMIIAGWLGCSSIGCGYGAEVETLAGKPAWIALEARDRVALYAPRYNTHALGMLLGLALLTFAARLLWRGWLQQTRLWLLLMLAAAGMFAIGFLRGDYAVYAAGLRLDQWLDLLIFGVGITAILAINLKFSLKFHVPSLR